MHQPPGSCNPEARPPFSTRRYPTSAGGRSSRSSASGRRINAIRHLTTDRYRTETRIVTLADDTRGGLDFGVVTFPAATDKAKKKGEAYFFGRAKERIERLLATPACQASGLFFPKGDLMSDSPAADPLGEDQLRDLLREAEQLAGVERVKGRSYHGFNRTFATTHDDILAASGQSGKRRETMETIYEGARPEAKAGLAMRLDSMLKGA